MKKCKNVKEEWVSYRIPSEENIALIKRALLPNGSLFPQRTYTILYGGITTLSEVLRNLLIDNPSFRKNPLVSFKSLSDDEILEALKRINSKCSNKYVRNIEKAIKKGTYNMDDLRNAISTFGFMTALMYGEVDLDKLSDPYGDDDIWKK